MESLPFFSLTSLFFITTRFVRPNLTIYARFHIFCRLLATNFENYRFSAKPPTCCPGVNAREKNPRGGRGEERRGEEADDKEGGGRGGARGVYGCTRESIMQEQGPSTRPYLQRVISRVSERERKKKEDGERGGKLTGIIAGQSRATHVVATKCG